MKVRDGLRSLQKVGRVMSLASITPAATRPFDGLPQRRCRQNPNTPLRPRRRKRLIISVLLAALLCGFGSWLALRHRDTGPRSDLETEVVHRGDLPMDIVTRGDLGPAEATDLFCRVKAIGGSPFSTTIKWVVEQGQWVKRGDLVVQLDDAPFQEDLALRRPLLEQARSEWLQASENCKIVVIQNESDITGAEAAFRLAQIDLKKYVEADHEQ